MIYWIHLIKIYTVFTQTTSLMLMVIQMQWTPWVGSCCSANLGLISDQGGLIELVSSLLVDLRQSLSLHLTLHHLNNVV